MAMEKRKTLSRGTLARSRMLNQVMAWMDVWTAMMDEVDCQAWGPAG